MHRATKAAAAEDRRPQVGVGQTRAAGDPPVGPVAHQRDDPRIAQEEHELQRSAEDILPAAGRGRGLGRRRDWRPGHSGRGVGQGRRVGEGRGQAADRRMPVDVLHRYRRQIPAFPDPGAEMGHDQRVGAQLIEEVAAGRHLLGVHDARQDLGQGSLDAGGAPVAGAPVAGAPVAGAPVVRGSVVGAPVAGGPVVRGSVVRASANFPVMPAPGPGRRPAAGRRRSARLGRARPRRTGPRTSWPGRWCPSSAHRGPGRRRPR